MFLKVAFIFLIVSDAALLRLISGIAGFLIGLPEISSTRHVPKESGVAPMLVSMAFGPIGMFLGIISLVRIKRLSGRLKGSGIAIIGLITSALVIILWLTLMFAIRYGGAL